MSLSLMINASPRSSRRPRALRSQSRILYRSRRSLFAEILCALAAILVFAALGRANDEPRHYSYFRGYLEAYAKAELPHGADQLVAIIGFVNKPNIMIPAKGGMTLRAAIDQAGGFAPFADHIHVGIWRNDDGRFLMADTSAIAAGKSPDLVLLKGDIVIVTGRRMNGI